MALPISPEYASQLHTLIVQGTQLLQELTTLLDTELEAMQARSLDALNASNRDKQTCLLAIDRNIRERNGLLDLQQIAHDRASVLALLNRIAEPDAQVMTDTWHQLEAALDEIRTKNQRNEQVLLRSKQSNDQLLALLQGHAQGNSIYDQKGDKGRYEGQRSLGKA